MSEPAFSFDAAARRYVATVEGQVAAYAEVDPIGADAMLIKHTEVDPAFEGQGLGGKLVRHMLEHSRAGGRSVIPVCPFAAAWIQRHPEFLDYVRESYRGVLRR